MINRDIKKNAEAGIQRFHLDRASLQKANHQLSDQLASTETLIWGEVPEREIRTMGQAHRTLGIAVTPVGEYGSQFARDLLRTTEVLIDLAGENLRDESATAFHGAPALLKGETVRARNAGADQLDLEKAPLSSLAEGIISLHQYFSFTLAEKIPGADAGEAALHDVIFKGDQRLGLTSEFVARLPTGLIGPLTLTGTHIRHPLIRTADGNLVYTSEFKDVLARLQEHETSRLSRCPMASLFRQTPDSAPTTGLQQLAETYWAVFEKVSQQDN